MDIKRINLSGKSPEVYNFFFFFNDEEICTHAKRLGAIVIGLLSGRWTEVRLI